MKVGASGKPVELRIESIDDGRARGLLGALNLVEGSERPLLDVGNPVFPAL